MKEASKILFISQEITPYLPESDIANIGRFLPQAVQEKGREMRAFMPRFGCINERRNQLHEVIRLSGMNLIIDDTDHPLIIKVASIQSARMQVYFIDNDDFFQRKFTTSDESGVDYDDNDERSIFFVRGVLETVKKLRWAPDVIHCHGWMTALAALYVKKAYNEDPFFKDAKIVYSIYEDGFSKPFNNHFAEHLMLEGVEPTDLSAIQGASIDYDAITKLAIDHADGIIVTHDKLNGGVKDYIAKKGVASITHTDKENYVTPYLEFYDSLFI